MNDSIPSKPNTFKELFDDIKRGIINNVEILTINLSTVYTAHNSLDNDDLSINTSYIWCYMSRDKRFSEF